MIVWQIGMNVLIAFIWMFLQNSWSAPSFIVGYIIGLLLLWMMRRFFKRDVYVRKAIAVIKLLLIFIRELFMSSYVVLKAILRPKANMNPGVIAVPLQLKKDWEVTLFACLVTLTPGTLSLEISPEGDLLYIHAMDMSDADELVQQVKETFEKAIMEVSR